MTKKKSETDKNAGAGGRAKGENILKREYIPLLAVVLVLAGLLALGLTSGDLFDSNFIGMVIGSPSNTADIDSGQPTPSNLTDESGVACTSGSDCFPQACHDGFCTKNCYSHDECGGPEPRGYFCNYQNKCAYVGDSNYRMLCSQQICCSNCSAYNPVCGSGTDSVCMTDEFSTDGSAYCTQSPFCITGPNREENINGGGDLLFGAAVLPNYVKCIGNTAYRCIGYGQTQDPDYKNNDNLWSVTKCKRGETCVEGIADQGGGCIPSRRG